MITAFAAAFIITYLWFTFGLVMAAHLTGQSRRGNFSLLIVFLMFSAISYMLWTAYIPVELFTAK